MRCSLWEGIACSQAAQSFGLLQRQRLINSWIKIALQYWYSCLVKCLQGAIIALGLQGKIFKNTRGGENTFQLPVMEAPHSLRNSSPLLPLYSELFPVCLHWFWTDDQMWKEVILPNKIQGFYLGRSEFLETWLRAGGWFYPSQLKPRPGKTHHFPNIATESFW